MTRQHKCDVREAFGTVYMAGEFHKTSFPVERLPGWIAFYRRMYEKYRKPTYKMALDALVEVDASL